MKALISFQTCYNNRRLCTEKDRHLKELIDLINQFRDERDWRKFHNEKDLAILISLEVSELLNEPVEQSSDEK